MNTVLSLKRDSGRNETSDKGSPPSQTGGYGRADKDETSAVDAAAIANAKRGHAYQWAAKAAHSKGVVDTPLEPPVAGEITSPCIPPQWPVAPSLLCEERELMTHSTRHS